MIKEKIAIIANDAGSAEIISSWMPYNKHDYFISVYGPAKDIFSRKIKNIQIMKMEEAINLCDWVITGTGWSSNIEYNAIILSKKKNKKVVSVIDHWVNYRERFIRDNKISLPDEIWVTDGHAYDLALQAFKTIKIVIIENYYVTDILRKVIPYSKVENNKVLYILEPIRLDWGINKIAEFEALDYFINNLSRLELPFNTGVSLRLHPSENECKYDNWINKNNKVLDINIDNNSDMIQSINQSKWVVGCESFALYLALKSKRKVFYSLPPHAPKSRLPFDRINYIYNL